MHTTSYWLTMPRGVMAALPYGADDRRDGVVGLAFAMRHVAQLLLMCDRPRPRPVDRRRRARGRRRGPAASAACPTALAAEPTIFIYDNYPGGIGFSEPLFEMHDALLDAHARADRRLPVRVAAARRASGPEGDTGPHAKAVALAISRSAARARSRPS